MMRFLKNRGFIYLGITIVFFSTYEVVSRTLTGRVDPFQVNFLRYCCGGLILLPAALVELKKRKTVLKARDYLSLAWLGLLMVGISMNLLQYGINLTRANLAAVIFSSNPLFVALAAALLLGEHLSFLKIGGLLAGFLGVAVTFVGNGGVGAGYYQGITCLVLSALTFGIYTVAGKKIALKNGSLAMNSLTFLFGSLSLVPVLLLRKVPFFQLNTGVWPQLLYLTVCVTGLAYYCYFKGLSMTDTSLGSMVFFIKPLLAGVLAAITLGEKVTGGLILGTLMVLASIYLVQKETVGRLPDTGDWKKADIN